MAGTISSKAEIGLLSVSPSDVRTSESSLSQWRPADSFISYALQPIFRSSVAFRSLSALSRGELLRLISAPFLGVFSVTVRILAPSIIDNSAPAPRGINRGNETKRRSYCVQCTLNANYGSPSFSASHLGMWLCRRILKLEIDLLRVVLPLPFRPPPLVPRPPSVISRSSWPRLQLLPPTSEHRLTEPANGT